MTPRQAQLLVYIHRRQTEEGGVTPTREEMSQSLRISRGGVAVMLRGLAARGWIRLEARQYRSIEVLRVPPAVLSADEVAWCHDHAAIVRGVRGRLDQITNERS